MGQLTLDSTAVSQSSRGTFHTRGWWHDELQPTACGHMAVHLYVGQLSLTIQVHSQKYFFTKEVCPNILHLKDLSEFPFHFAKTCKWILSLQIAPGVFCCKGLASISGSFPLINEFVPDMLYLWRAFWPQLLSKGLLVPARLQDFDSFAFMRQQRDARIIMLKPFTTLPSQDFPLNKCLFSLSLNEVTQCWVSLLPTGLCICSVQCVGIDFCGKKSQVSDTFSFTRLFCQRRVEGATNILVCKASVFPVSASAVSKH